MSDTRKSSALAAAALALVPATLVPAVLALRRLDPAEPVFGLSPQFWSGFLIGLMGVLLLAGIAGLYSMRKGDRQGNRLAR